MPHMNDRVGWQQLEREKAALEAGEIDTHGFTMSHGKHAGELITRIPVGYLKWMVQSQHTLAHWAAAELKRRGTTTPDLDVSGHAIDRASLYLRKLWHETKLSDEEGLYSWLCRMAKGALAEGERLDSGKISFGGIKFVFDEGAYPVVKTVMPARGRTGEQKREAARRRDAAKGDS